MIKGILFDLGDTIVKEKDEGPSYLPEQEPEKVEYVEELLEGLRGKYKLAVVTNTFTSREKQVRDALKRMELEPYFHAVITSVDVEHNKPDKEIFEVALKALKLDSSEVVMIGDRIDTDIFGANRMGIKTILHRWNERYPEEISSSLHEPTFRVECLKEVPNILQSLNECSRREGDG